MNKRVKIDPEEWYSLFDVSEFGLFPWCTDIRTVRKWVNLDKKKKNVLKAVIQGEGRGTKYQIKGENIQKFITAVESGQYQLT